MVNVDMEVDFGEAVIVSVRERVQTARERGETVKSEKFDDESKVWSGRSYALVEAGGGRGGGMVESEEEDGGEKQ